MTRTTTYKTAVRPTALVAAFAAFALSLFAIVAPAMASHVEPTEIDGNHSCGQLNVAYDHEFKVEPVTGGTKDDPNSAFSVTLTLHDTADGQTFDFDANLAVDAVFAKGGNEGNLYVYDPAETSDTGLHAPANSSGSYAGLSHISFCFNDVPEPSEEPSEEPSQEPSQEPSEEPSEAPSQTPEQSVAGATGTPEASLPDGAMGATSGSNPLPTLLFSLVLLTSLGTLAYANVRTTRS